MGYLALYFSMIFFLVFFSKSFSFSFFLFFSCFINRFITAYNHNGITMIVTARSNPIIKINKGINRQPIRIAVNDTEINSSFFFAMLY